MSIHDDSERVLLSEEQIKNGVERAAAFLTEKVKDKNPVVVCIMSGSIIFFSDLIRKLDFPMTVDCMSASSYDDGTVSKGVRIKQDLKKSVKNRTVVVVEDIIDSGRTVAFLKKYFALQDANEVYIITLLDKPSRRTEDVTVDYSCFEIEDEFVIGYGLDYDEKYRNLPYIGILKRSIYEK